MEKKEKFGLTANMLKLIACATMLIDHIGCVFFPSVWILRYIGRIAMPIYCYQTAIGGIFTHDRKKYVLRMAAFLLLSEIPFDLAFQNQFFYWGYNSVMVTLLLGLLCVLASEEFKKRITKPRLWILPSLCAFFIGGVLAELANSDYGCIGVAFIACFYYFRNKPVPMALTFIFTATVPVAIRQWGFDGVWAMIRGGDFRFPIETFAAAALFFIFLHNGERGKKTKAIQYGFYAFYPVHLALIAAVYFMIYGS
ncbi:MAG: TraX protein [Clostridia bacterium]|nr:TraX protein [Clostridia bacterium]